MLYHNNWISGKQHHKNYKEWPFFYVDASSNFFAPHCVGFQPMSQTRTSFSEGTDGYPHMPILRPLSAWYIATVMFTSGWAWPARWPIRPIFCFWGNKVHKNLWFPTLDVVNRRAKFDAASFVLNGEIRIHKNTHKQKMSTPVGTDLYPHTPILRVGCVASTLDESASARATRAGL